jgi:parvulin-like peptidyl-prolyl isomerase
MTVIVSKSGSGDKETINGYYVLRFGSVEDNTFKLKNVRHLLVAFEGGKTDANGNKTYTEAEKNAAKAAAEKLLAEFEATGKTEADFEKLAKEHTDDTGSKENGGLYEDIYPGQMVTEFEDWCFDEERKAGDYGLVKTDYGYHIMYYVGESETNYRDFMIDNDLRAETMEKWMEDLVKKAVLTLNNLKYVNRELVLSKG